MNITIDNYHKFSFKNRNLLTDEYSCYFCLKTGKVTEIMDWVDNSLTALCPHCTIDSVLPEVIDSELLNKISEKAFS